MITIQAALASGAEQLRAHHAARLEAEVLLAHVLNRSRAQLRAWPEQTLNTEQQRRFFALIARRAGGEPVAYLTGHREFWSLDLMVNRHTLIPRPETERLVELALARLPQDQDTRVADLGTGSGAIALAIAIERPRCNILATDISDMALQVAQANANRLGLPNVEFRRGSWLAPLRGERFDLVASNPPYVAAADRHLAEGGLAAEPREALVAGESGVEMLSAIIDGAAEHLHRGGWLLLEHGHDQATGVAVRLRAAGFEAVSGWRDGAGIERVAGGRRP